MGSVIDWPAGLRYTQMQSFQGCDKCSKDSKSWTELELDPEFRVASWAAFYIRQSGSAALEELTLSSVNNITEYILCDVGQVPSLSFIFQTTGIIVFLRQLN